MATKKKLPKKIVKKKPKLKEPLDPNVEEIYEEEVWFTCPTRGRIKQKVKIKRLKSRIVDEKELKPLNVNNLLDNIEQEDDGLSIYTEEELTKEEKE